MIKVYGAKELRARFKALRQVFKPIGRDWADRTVHRAKGRVRVKTGATQRSIRRKHATQRKAAVVASYGARFLDEGTKAHPIRARKFRAMRFTGRTGQPVFAKRVQHPGGKAYPFLRVSAKDELHSDRNLGHIIDAWNSAAPGISAPGLTTGKRDVRGI